MFENNFKTFLRKRIRVVCFVLVSVLVLGYHTLSLYVVSPLDSMRLYESLKIETVDPLQTCQIPLNHPFDPDVVSYFRTPTPVKCKVRMPLLSYVDSEGYLRYNVTAFREAGYAVDDLSCTYQEILRGAADGVVVYTEAKPLSGMEKPESDFTRVSCSRFSWLPARYSMYHAAVQRTSHTRQFVDDEELGVAVVGLDSVSRLNFMRQLPKSYATLTNIMDAIVFKGFNKVGLNTLPNIVPILTGNPPSDTSDSTTFDDWEFLWKPLKADGVATLYGEDMPHISTFSWWGAGFQQDPTHHYFNRFWTATAYATLNAISSPMCLGALPRHQIYLNYLTSFLRAYKESPTFMFSLENEPCHDYMNLIGVIDDDLEQFLLNGIREGLFNRTVLFIIGDHGHRTDPFRQTLQGKLEDFMPMVAMVLPPWLHKKHPHLVKVLQTNSGRLSSSYDLYSTFTDIFLRKTFDKKLQSRYNFAKPKHGQSLLQPIALNRTCTDAGIPERYCICKRDTEELPTSDKLVTDLIPPLIDYFNNQVLSGESRLWKKKLEKTSIKMDKSGVNSTIVQEILQCSKLKIQTVEAARKILSSDGAFDLVVEFRTSPNNGLYEARIPANSIANAIDEGINENISIDRLNRYGSQSECLSRSLLIILPLIRSVCFCS